MYDEIILSCPGCGEPVEFQSRAGDCSLATYGPDDVPAKIALDIDGDTEQCTRCGKVLRVESFIPQVTKLRLVIG